LREFINIYVDGLPAEMSTTIEPTSTVHILPAVAGG
jgi:molybdopterin converting factor small subunit